MNGIIIRWNTKQLPNSKRTRIFGTVLKCDLTLREFDPINKVLKQKSKGYRVGETVAPAGDWNSQRVDPKQRALWHCISRLIYIEIRGDLA